MSLPHGTASSLQSPAVHLSCFMRTCVGMLNQVTHATHLLNCQSVAWQHVLRQLSRMLRRPSMKKLNARFNAKFGHLLNHGGAGPGQRRWLEMFRWRQADGAT
jgi:hypothetical protein